MVRSYEHADGLAPSVLNVLALGGSAHLATAIDDQPMEFAWEPLTAADDAEVARLLPQMLEGEADCSD